MATGDILQGWGQKPQINLGPSCPGRYRVRKCYDGGCSLQIDFETKGTPFGSLATLYHGWVAAYPTLTIIWRFWLEMDGLGYIDDGGCHWFQDGEGEDGAAPAEELACDVGQDDLEFITRMQDMADSNHNNHDVK